MRIVVTTAGSRGDVQPYVALGLGLAARGHAVTLATHAPFAGLAQAHGLAFRPLAGDPQAMLGGEAGKAWMASAGDPLKFLRHYRELMEGLVEPLMRDLRDVTADAEALVASPLTYPALDFAEARRIPAAVASPVPITATTEFPFMVMPPAVWANLRQPPGPLERAGNWLSHQLLLHLASIASAGHLNRWRMAEGLWPLPLGGLSLDRQARMRMVYGFSRHVVPRPADWGPNVALTGDWALDPPAGWAPTPELAAWLAGEPPVYVGFGSMIGRDPDRLTRDVCEALRLAGRRGVLLAGWQDLGRGDLPDHVLRVTDVPHAWLFPRCAAVVHHGGAGTTAAGLRAGVPSVLCPYFADQPFWASRVQALGVGPPAVPQAELTPERLAAAIRQAVEDPGQRARAAALGERLRAEDGVAMACDVLEGWLQ